MYDKLQSLLGHNLKWARKGLNVAITDSALSKSFQQQMYVAYYEGATIVSWLSLCAPYRLQKSSMWFYILLLKFAFATIDPA